MNVEFEKSSAIVSNLKASKRKPTALSCSCSARQGGARDRNRIGAILHDHDHEYRFTEHEHGWLPRS